MIGLRRAMIGALVAAAGLLAQPAQAVQFTWSQHGGFEFGSGTLRAGGFFGADLPAVAGNGGLEYFGPQGGNAPANTYRTIGWGCPPDGNADGSVDEATCAGGVSAEVLAASDPATNAARSSLVVDVFNSGESGVLDSETEVWRVISRITHNNTVLDNEGNLLATVSIAARLIVDAVPPVDDPDTIPIGFLETLNVSDCTETSDPLGSQCDDVFTFAGDFNAVPFSHGGEDFALEFRLRPTAACSTPAGSQGTIAIFQCFDSPDHRIAIDLANFQAWAMEGFDSAFQVEMRVVGTPRTDVPMPAGVVLIVAGIAGWGIRAWRRRGMA